MEPKVLLLLICLGLLFLTVSGLAKEKDQAERRAKSFLHDLNENIMRRNNMRRIEHLCTTDDKCRYGDGDCNWGAACVDELVCGDNNCKTMNPARSEYAWDDDCCTTASHEEWHEDLQEGQEEQQEEQR